MHREKKIQNTEEKLDQISMCNRNSALELLKSVDMDN